MNGRDRQVSRLIDQADAAEQRCNEQAASLEVKARQLRRQAEKHRRVRKTLEQKVFDEVV